MDTNRIVFDWGHKNVILSITEVNKPSPKTAPPPPPWRWGPIDDGDRDSVDGGELVEDSKECCVYDYHHGRAPAKHFFNPFFNSSGIDNTIGPNDPGHLTKKCTVSAPQSICGEGNASSLPLDTGQSVPQIPPADNNAGSLNGFVAKKAKTEFPKKRKPFIENTTGEECLIGQKISKTRVSVASCMYAKPSSKGVKAEEEVDAKPPGNTITSTEDQDEKIAVASTVAQQEAATMASVV